MGVNIIVEGIKGTETFSPVALNVSIMTTEEIEWKIARED